MKYELIDKDQKVIRVIIADEAFVVDHIKDKDGYTYRLVPEPVYVPPPPPPTIEERLLALESALSAIGGKIDVIKTDVAIIKSK